MGCIIKIEIGQKPTENTLNTQEDKTMKKTTKFNKREIMKRAWDFVKKAGYTLSTALKLAWANAKKLIREIIESGIQERMLTYMGWQNVGKEVIHGQKTVLQVVLPDPTKAKGRTILSYFTESQVTELGTQD